MCAYVVFLDTDIIIFIQYTYKVKNSDWDYGVGEASSNPRPTNILRKGLYSSLLPTPAMGKYQGSI